MTIASFNSTSVRHLEVFMSHADLEEREEALVIDGQRIGLLLSFDGQISISSLDGFFVEVATNNEFETDIEKCLEAAAHYDVVVAPLFEQDAYLVGWDRIDLNVASAAAERFGIQLIVRIDNSTSSKTLQYYH